MPETKSQVVGYYAVAADEAGKIRLMWVERQRVEGAPGTKPRGQWWCDRTFRSMAAAERELGALNAATTVVLDDGCRVGRAVAPERVFSNCDPRPHLRGNAPLLLGQAVAA